MIEVNKLTKVYGKKQNKFVALKNISFNIPNGSTVAIIGKSGSGKSTLMHIMSGLDRPDEGTVTIGGHTLHKLKKKAMDEFRAKQMGFIFQAFFVEANQTVYQNVSLPLEIGGIGVRKRDTMIKEALERVELSDKINSKAGDLSGGQKQRLAIARAIVTKPNLIFADEPTGNLDSTTGEKIIKLLFELNKSLGSTLIVVTHDHELAAKCNIIITLKDGAVVSVENNETPKQKAISSVKRVRKVKAVI
jgi:putative ABC transport system ATP-binding protein